MKKIIVIIILVVIVALAAILAYGHFKKSKTVEVEIGGQKFDVLVAISDEAKKRGLAGKKELCQNCGMLFLFPEKGQYGFWMKGMLIDLDLIWIADGKVVYIAKNVSKSSQETMKPDAPANQVLEINKGLADRYGIKIGDSVKIAK